MHPYATSKDAFGMFVFLMLFAWFVFFLPDYLGHADNYIEANPLVTPPHIVPEWYFLPFYAILRAFRSFLGIPLGSFAKLLGVLAMFALDRRARVRAVARHQPRALGQVPSDVQVVLLAVRLHLRRTRLSRLASRLKACTCCGRRSSRSYYFAFFLVVMPIVGLIETPLNAAALHHRGGARQRR